MAIGGRIGKPSATAIGSSAVGGVGSHAPPELAWRLRQPGPCFSLGLGCCRGRFYGCWRHDRATTAAAAATGTPITLQEWGAGRRVAMRAT